MPSRRLKLIVGGGLAAVVVGVGVGASIPSKTSVAPGQGPQVASLLGARSPGLRGSAAVSTKAPAVRPTAYTPTFAPSVASERSPAIKTASLGPVPVMAAAPAAAAPVAVPLAAAPIAVPVAAAALTPAVIGAPIAAGVGGGGGGALIGAAAALPIIPALLGGGGGDGGGSSVSIAPAVPEPATWLMMILGFGLLGSALRRRRNRQRAAGSSTASSGVGALVRS